MADRYISIAKPARKQTVLKIRPFHIRATSPMLDLLRGNHGGLTAFYVTAHAFRPA